MSNPPSDPRSRRDVAGGMTDLMDQAREAGLDPGRLEPTFERFLGILNRFAELEVRVLGSVPLQFPTYMYEVDRGAAFEPLAAGTELARRERDRLDLDAGAVDDPIGLVEAQGLKVVQVAFPPDSGLLGAFLFDAGTGPAILLDAVRPERERAYAAVHAYGHFLADYDPYRTWVCRRAPTGGTPPEEVRADSFASAFLVPPGDLALYLSGSGVRPGEALTGSEMVALRVYFNCDDRALIGTLLSSGWLSPDGVATLLEAAGPPAAEEEPSARDPDLSRGGGAPLPGRFVGMAVAAHRTGALTLAEMARYLEVDEATALLVERSLTVLDGRGTDARSPS